MAVSKMKKLTLAVMKKDCEELIRRLLWLGAIEVARVSPNELSKKFESSEGSELIGVSNADAQYAPELEEAKRNAELITDAMNALNQSGNVKHGLFSALPEISQAQFELDDVGDGKTYQDIIELAHRINKITEEKKNLQAECATLLLRAESLKPWLAFERPLSELSTESCEIILGAFPISINVSETEAAINNELPYIALKEISSDKTSKYVCIAVHKENEEGILSALSRFGFHKTELSDASDTAAAELDKIQSRLRDEQSEEEKLKNELAELSGMYDRLAIALDMAQTKIREAQAKQRLICTDRTAILSGWIPSDNVKALEAELKTVNCSYSIEEPSEDDNVPVKLINRRPASYFEGVVGMYSYPAYGTFDPTFIMSLFFFAIFGMMLADVLYGIVMLIGCAIIVKKTNLSRSVKGMCSMFGICGISCIIWGVIFGSYFGDLPVTFMKNMFGIDISVWAAVDIMTEAMTFLVLSLAMGAIHMLAGMGIRAYVLAKNGMMFAAIFDEGSWFVLFAGIGLYFLNSTVGTIVLITGILMLVLTQGRHEKNPIMKLIKGVGSLYSLVNYASDLLSYSRIMALGLSSAVVASVFNTIATMGGFTIPGIIVFIIIIPVGHLLNLALNVLGTFVHTSRLQYIEFFGKFFEDGGKQFEPLEAHISHSEIAKKNN